MAAHFTSTKTDDGIRFNVTPAPAPKTGCIGMPTLILSGLVVLFTFANPLLVLSWPIFAGIAWFSWKFVKEARADAAGRVPQTIHVSPTAVLIDGNVIPSSDIAEVQWAPRNAGGPALVVATPDSHSLAASQAMGQNMRAKIEHANWIVRLRLRSDSRPVTIAHHLDPDTAEALGKDISAALA